MSLFNSDILTACSRCKHSMEGIDAWYCRKKDEYFKGSWTGHVCDGFDRHQNHCDACYHMKPARNGSGVLECYLNANTPVKYKGKKCPSFLPRNKQALPEVGK